MKRLSVFVLTFTMYLGLFNSNAIEAISNDIVASSADILFGDVGGDGLINSLDAALVLKHDVCLITLEAAGLAAADVNGDGGADNLDAAMILKYDAKIIESFPVNDNAPSEDTSEYGSEEDSGIEDSCSEESDPEDSEARHTITFLDYDGRVLKETVISEGEEVVPPPEPAREGYIFIGWDKDFSNVVSDLQLRALYEKIETAKEWLSDIVFGINYFNGINENNDNDAYFRWIVEQGFNAVEIGCRFPHLVNSIHGDLNLEYVEKLKTIIDYAYKYDLYVILSLYDGYDYMWTSLNYDNQDSIIEMLNTSYKKLVESLNAYDDKLAISFCSEPRDYTDNLIDEEACNVLNAINREFVDMVRATGGNNLYRKLVITTGWSRCSGIAAEKFEMVDDEYTFVRIHLYEPGDFANSKTEEPVFNEIQHQLELVEAFNNIKRNFIDKGIPVYIGEFGCRPKNNDEERVKWAKCYLSLANCYNIKCFIWDTENKGSGIENSFAISNKERLEWLNPVFMNYILDMFKNNTFIDYYDTYNYTVSINDPIELERTVKNIRTNETETISVNCDDDKLILLNGNYYAKESGEIIFNYNINNHNYYYIVNVIDNYEKIDFELEFRREATTNYYQLWITTAGFSKSRLDYDWISTNEDVIKVSKYSTITIVGDGKSSVIAKEKSTGAIGVVDFVVENNEIVDIFVHTVS